MKIKTLLAIAATVLVSYQVISALMDAQKHFAIQNEIECGRGK